MNIISKITRKTLILLAVFLCTFNNSTLCGDKFLKACVPLKK